MLTVDAQSVRASIPAIARTPSVISAPRFAVFSDTWWAGDWSTYWRAQKRFLDLRYAPGSGMCDEFTAAALASAIVCGRRTLGSMDCRIAAWEARIRIPAGVHLHGVSDGYHSLLLVGHRSPDETEPQWALWEPQRDGWREAHTPLGELPRGIEITDVWL